MGTSCVQARRLKRTVGATVTNPDGSKKPMPGMKFRVKNVPNPRPYFGGKSVDDETIKKAELTAAAGVIAKMIDFEFDLKFEMVEYKVTMIVNGGTPIEKIAKGAAVSGDMKEMFQKAKPGQKVYIEGIKARGPDGTTRNLGFVVVQSGVNQPATMMRTCKNILTVAPIAVTGSAPRRKQWLRPCSMVPTSRSTPRPSGWCPIPTSAKRT
jgi:hypothetical protein